MNCREVRRRIERLSFLNGLVVTGALVSNRTEAEAVESVTN